MFVLNSQAIDNKEQILSLALHGMATFTTLLVEDDGVRGLDKHLDRLERDSVALFGLKVERSTVLDNIRSFLSQRNQAATPATSVVIRVTVFPDEFSISSPCDYSFLNVLVTGRPAPELAPEPIKVGLVDTSRYSPLQKNSVLMPAIQARRAAQQQGYQDALLVREGKLLEGTTWNVVFIKNNTLYVSALEEFILPGITQKIIEEIAVAQGISVKKMEILVDQLRSYDAAFATSSVRGVIPITAIDRVPFPLSDDSQNLIQQLAQFYRRYPKEQV